MGISDGRKMCELVGSRKVPADANPTQRQRNPTKPNNTPFLSLGIGVSASQNVFHYVFREIMSAGGTRMKNRAREAANESLFFGRCRKLGIASLVINK